MKRKPKKYIKWKDLSKEYRLDVRKAIELSVLNGHVWKCS